MPRASRCNLQLHAAPAGPRYDRVWRLPGTHVAAATPRIGAHQGVRMIRILATAIAVLFGIATLFAGGRVLLGSDPG